jgi:putative redox protein
MFVDVSWSGDLAFEARTESGHSFPLDAKPEVGGHNQGPAPMEVLLVSLAGCTGMDVASILKKKRVALHKMNVKVNGERAPEHPKYFTKIEVEFSFEGNSIREEDVRQAIELSRDKYCSVSVMLKDKAEISYRWSIVNRD